MRTTQKGWGKASGRKAMLLLGMSAMALAFVAMMAGCGDSGGGGGDPPAQKADVIITASDLDDMATLIEAADGGATKEDPVVVAITADAEALSGANSSGTDPLDKLFEAIPGDKYVAFDLSGCTFTSIEDIDYNAAQARNNKDRLVSITLPNTLASIGYGAFAGCSGLTSVAIPDSVTSIGIIAFYGCSGLTSVTIPDSVTSIGNMAFASCTNLSVIQVSENNTAYTAIEGVLFNKAGTELIAYPAGSGSTYTIPNSVTSIGYSAFNSCSGLTSVTIPNSVTSIGEYAFADCSGLTSVTIPNSVTSIGNQAFINCSGLTSVYVLRDTAGSLTTLGSSNAFRATHDSLAIYVPASVVSNYKEMSGWSTYQSKIQQIP